MFPSKSLARNVNVIYMILQYFDHIVLHVMYIHVSIAVNSVSISNSVFPGYLERLTT